MHIEQFNALNENECRDGFVRCCGAARWVEGMLAARPFRDVAHLYETAGNLWWLLDPADWQEAFTHHPKIGGDMDELRRKFAQTATWSANEQASVHDANEATLQGLSEGNLAYEAKFGYIFIVCATGKSAAEMLALLQQRFPNALEDEIFIAAEEQRKITFLRLAKWLGCELAWAREVAMARLLAPDGRMVMQLRDDLARIAWPNSWTMFGGGLNDGEGREVAVLRELSEELRIEPDERRSHFRRSYVEVGEKDAKILYLFEYRLAAEMDTAVIQEGQRFDWFTVDDVVRGEKDGHQLVPHHQELLLWLDRDLAS